MKHHKSSKYLAWLVRAFLLISATLTATGLAAGWAAACSCADSSIEEQASMADVVAKGVVAEKDPPLDAGAFDAEITYVIEPQRIYKGDVVADMIVKTAANSASCGIDYLSPGDIVMVFGTKEADHLTTDICSGTAVVSDELENDVTQQLGDGVAYGEATSNPNTDDSGAGAFWIWAISVAAFAGLVIAAVIVWLRSRRKRGAI